jgi:uncharacterized protein (TIGR02391 family)
MSVSVDEFPSASEVAALPLDQLARQLLALLRSQKEAGSKAQILGVINRSVWAHRVTQGEMEAFLRHLQEAWDWLLTRGLIASEEPSQHIGGGWTFVTRAGRVVLDDPAGAARMAAQQRLDVDLHERIRDRVRPQFLLGEYELAAFAALREVEIRVRELSEASDSLLGVPLMTQAFRAGGALFDPNLDRGESTALMNLFQGAIGVFKNPPSHRQVEYGDPTEASEVVLLADLLLRLLDQVGQRLLDQEMVIDE